MAQNDPTRNRRKPPPLSPVPEEESSYAANDKTHVISTPTNAPTYISHTNTQQQEELPTPSPIPRERVQSFAQHTSLKRKRLRHENNAHNNHRVENFPHPSVPDDRIEAFTHHTSFKRARLRHENDSPLDHRTSPPPASFTRASPQAHFPIHQTPEGITRQNYLAWRWTARAHAADANGEPRLALLERQVRYKAEWEGWWREEEERRMGGSQGKKRNRE